MSKDYKITKPVRLIETFSGIGAQAMAMKRLGVPFEHWRTSDWDVNAVKSYKAIHCAEDTKDYSEKFTKEQVIDILFKLGISNDGKEPLAKEKIAHKSEKWLRETFNNFAATKNLGSITNVHAKQLRIVDQDKYEYFLFYSFPCTDLSLAGKQKGMNRDSNTASSLIWQIERILKECQEENCLPQLLCMENVSQVHGKKNIENWNEWLNILKKLGYLTYWQDLNAKDYGIPQNRLRTFALSILGDYTYTFPEPIPLKKRLKDVLEDHVDEKYYISSEKADKLIGNLIDRGVLPRERERGIDLATRGTDLREVANCIKTVQRGIVNFAQSETGVIENDSFYDGNE